MLDAHRIVAVTRPYQARIWKENPWMHYRIMQFSFSSWEAWCMWGREIKEALGFDKFIYGQKSGRFSALVGLVNIWWYLQYCVSTVKMYMIKLWPPSSRVYRHTQSSPPEISTHLNWQSRDPTFRDPFNLSRPRQIDNHPSTQLRVRRQITPPPKWVVFTVRCCPIYSTIDLLDGSIFLLFGTIVNCWFRIGRGKGISASALPYSRAPPSWSKTTSVNPPNDSFDYRNIYWHLCVALLRSRRTSSSLPARVLLLLRSVLSYVTPTELPRLRLSPVTRFLESLSSYTPPFLLVERFWLTSL